VTVPGDIDYASSNLTVEEARVAVARVRDADIRSATELVLALAPRCEIEFRGAGVTIALADRDPGVGGIEPSAGGSGGVPAGHEAEGRAGR
jgi:hypothetical protein